MYLPEYELIPCIRDILKRFICVRFWVTYVCQMMTFVDSKDFILYVQDISKNDKNISRTEVQQEERSKVNTNVKPIGIIFLRRYGT